MVSPITKVSQNITGGVGTWSQLRISITSFLKYDQQWLSLLSHSLARRFNTSP